MAYLRYVFRRCTVLNNVELLRFVMLFTHGSPLVRMQVLYHEQVHAFFTPRGLFQGIRVNISMWAYSHSHLLRYAEEAIAETTAQVKTGGSIQIGLLFPILNGYVSPLRIALEAGGVIGGIYWIKQKIVRMFE